MISSVVPITRFDLLYGRQKLLEEEGKLERKDGPSRRRSMPFQRERPAPRTADEWRQSA